MMPPFQFRLGQFKGVVFRDNSRVMPLQNAFPAVPPAELAAGLEALGMSGEETQVGYNVLLLDTGRQKVLIDTGSGQGDLAAGLAAVGLSPADIDLILITHGDGDHIGGILDFPAARFMLPRPSWELWTTVEGRARMVEEFIALFRDKTPADQLAQWATARAVYGLERLPALRERIDLVDPEEEFLPGFRFVAAAGHRSDHFGLEISSAGETLFHLVDGIRHPLQAVHPEWTSFIDSYPEQTAASNRRLMTRAAGRQALIFATHFPFPGLGRLRETGSNWRWESI